MAEDIMNLLIPKNVDNLQLPDPTLLQYYKDCDNRIYYLTGEVGEECMDLIPLILRYNKEDKGIPVEERKPFRILISSIGGTMEVEEMLVSFIKLSKTPIYTIAIGLCASAASMIYLAGHKRLAIKNAYWLLHKGSCSNLGGDYNQIQAFMDEYKHQVEEMAVFYKAHTTFDPTLIDAKLDKGDWYVRLPEACENGMVDEVVEDIEVCL